jgi:hypothetical protein
MVKLVMSWNVQPDCENEHFEFFIREFVPALGELGIQTSDAWYTLYGDYPKILAGALADDLESLKQALTTEEWHRLKSRLLTYVTDYSQKVIPASGGFQL